MSTNIEIVIGTYEEFLIGYKLESKDKTEVLTQSFADKSHSGALKCLAVHGQWIATGATDDRIIIYDMKTRKQSQILLNHDGTVNALAFTPDGTHLLSGGSDGRMIAVRLNTWFTEANWTKAHNGAAVTHICCHPSGKLALSLGSDLVLRTWNLVKGRVAYKTNLKSKSTTLGTMLDCLTWSPSGDFFTLTGQRVFEIWSIKSADVVNSKKTKSKPICVSWLKDDECLVGLEDGKILWINAAENDEQPEIVIEAHSSRVKTMSFRDNILVTASSSGEIKLWNVNANNNKLKMIAMANIGCRPTCIGILGLDQFGPNYVINNKIAQKTEEKPKCDKKSTSKPIPRGVVTIEYEDKEKQDDDDKNVDDINSHEANIKNKTHDDSVESSSDDQDSDHEEPQVSLPKSKKLKQKPSINKQKKVKNGNLSESSTTAMNKKRKAEIKSNERKAENHRKQKSAKTEKL